MVRILLRYDRLALPLRPLSNRHREWTVHELFRVGTNNDGQRQSFENNGEGFMRHVILRTARMLPSSSETARNGLGNVVDQRQFNVMQADFDAFVVKCERDGSAVASESSRRMWHAPRPILHLRSQDTTRGGMRKSSPARDRRRGSSACRCAAGTSSQRFELPRQRRCPRKAERYVSRGELVKRCVRRFHQIR